MKKYILILALFVACNTKSTKVQFVVSSTPTILTEGIFAHSNSATEPAIYFIHNNQKHLLTLQVWVSLNYPTYTVVDSTTLKNYPEGNLYQP